jgi:tetratricopeptide (TPR) repeat protein
VRVLCLAALLLFCASPGVRADQPSTLAAEHAAAGGDYQLAVRNYAQVLHQQGFSAPVLFNLGNAQLRLGKPALAILDYERALVLAPRNAAIQANLAAAQQRAGLAPTPVGPWLAAARYFSFDTYAWAALGAIWVLCAALVVLCLNGTSRRFARPLILAAAVTLCVSADAAALCWSDLYRAVVVQGPAVLHLAPATSAAVSSTLREGEVLWLQDRYAGFSFVRTADGHVGWVSDDTAVPVRVAPP